MTLSLMLALLLPLAGQTPKEPAKDLFMHTERAPGIEMRFVDYHWQPALFAAMESGRGDDPLAKRNWVYARLVLQTRPMTLEGKRIPVGNYGVALWPNLDGKGMAVEVRQVDMRTVFPNLNALAPLPPGETIYKGPARLETSETLTDRLAVDLVEKDGAVTMTLRYGNRRVPLVLTP
jgi:hypothetical protein